MKKYIILSIKTVILIVLVCLAIAEMPGISLLAIFISIGASVEFLQGDKIVFGYRSIRQGWVYNYAWSTKAKKQKAYRIAYVSCVILYLGIFLYGTISTRIEEKKSKASIARYMQYTQSDEYKKKQELFARRFNAAKARSKQ